MSHSTYHQPLTTLFFRGYSVHGHLSLNLLMAPCLYYQFSHICYVLFPFQYRVCNKNVAATLSYLLQYDLTSNSNTYLNNKISLCKLLWIPELFRFRLKCVDVSVIIEIKMIIHVTYDTSSEQMTTKHLTILT